MHKPRRVTGRVGRPRTIWEAKGISTYHIEPEGELGEILYGRMRNLIFRTKAEVIAEIRMSPYLYEQAGLKQVAVAGIKVGMLESIADDPFPSPSRPWLFRVEEGPYRKYFEWLDALRFPTIERFMEVFMRTYETDLRPANESYCRILVMARGFRRRRFGISRTSGSRQLRSRR